MCACNITKNFIRVYPRCFKLSAAGTPTRDLCEHASTFATSRRDSRNRYNFGEFNSPTHVRKNVPRVSEVIGSVLTSNVGNIPVCRTKISEPTEVVPVSVPAYASLQKKLSQTPASSLRFMQLEMNFLIACSQ